MEKLIAYRAHLSPYQLQSFVPREKEAFEAIGVGYTSQVEEANILITNTHVNLKEYSSKELKLILHPNSGYDNFLLEDIDNSICPIIIGNQVRAPGVSNYILACLMKHFAFPSHQKTWDKQRRWERKVLDQLHIQLIGHGHIGKILERSLSPLVNKLSIYDPFAGHHQLELQAADVIIFACGLNQTSRHFLSKDNFHELKEDCVIINGARGELIEQESLLSFLKNHPHSFAYLDVFEKEPADFAPFNLPNIHLTSHIAGVSMDLEDRIIKYEVDVLSNFLSLSQKDFSNQYIDSILQNRIKKIDGKRILL